MGEEVPVALYATRRGVQRRGYRREEGRVAGRVLRRKEEGEIKIMIKIKKEAAEKHAAGDPLNFSRV